MDSAEPEVDRAEEWLRLVLLVCFWSLWLVLRAGWWILLELLSIRTWKRLRKVFGIGLLAGLVLLGPHAVGLWWARMMLLDAAEIAALQSEGRSPEDIAMQLQRRAFRLGFRDIVLQPEAIKISWEDREAGRVCAVVLDFWHQPKIYGWDAPPLHIKAKVERYVVQAGTGSSRALDLLD